MRYKLLEMVLDRNADISSYDAVNLGAKQDALYRFKALISSIDVKVPPDVPQYLDTGDKFLNAAYHQAVLVKGSPETFEGDVGGLGKEGKDDVIDEMMSYIKFQVE